MFYWLCMCFIMVLMNDFYWTSLGLIGKKTWFMANRDETPANQEMRLRDKISEDEEMNRRCICQKQGLLDVAI